jgi:2-polyprenyl-6-methoxyphenol hydroxylase-like FAD-dependent oxidoreductase
VKVDDTHPGTDATIDWLAGTTHYRYCGALTGPKFAEKDHFATSNDISAASAPVPDVCIDSVSPSPVVHLAQSKLVRILLAKAVAHPLVTVSLGHECVGVSEHADGVSTVVRRLGAAGTASTTASAGAQSRGRDDAPGRSTNNDSSCHDDASALMTLESEYVIGADGAASRVRELMGIGLDSGPVLQHLLSVSSPPLSPWQT